MYYSNDITIGNLFLSKALTFFSIYSDINEFSVLNHLPITIINDVYNLTPHEIEQMSKNYKSYGFTVFKIGSYTENVDKHILLYISEQLKNNIPVQYPVKHFMESTEYNTSIGRNVDGTSKIFNSNLSRGQALSNKSMDWHQDGLGLGGKINSIALFMDTPPDYGGDLKLKNIILHAIYLSRIDRSAFDSLFDPDAITIIRPKSSKSIKICSPILYMGKNGTPMCFLRLPEVASNEYQVIFKNDVRLQRAINFFREATEFNIPFNERGFGCFINNNQVLHSRSAFIEKEKKRLVSRKWYSYEKMEGLMEHFPGIFMNDETKDYYPKTTEASLLKGTWQYDEIKCDNILRC